VYAHTNTVKRHNAQRQEYKQKRSIKSGHGNRLMMAEKYIVAGGDTLSVYSTILINCQDACTYE